jgi:sporulation protein YlmC with PRC-barrel domain
MKKHFLTLVAFATFTTVSFAQIGVNSDNSAPHPSAQLDIKSSDKGLLIPRLTTLERNGIQSPEIGLMVFDKDLQEIFIYNSDGWKQGTLSKLPLILKTTSLQGLVIINDNTNSFPNVSTAAEFISKDIFGIALKAESSGNPPTMLLTNYVGNGIESKSEGNGTGGSFNSTSGIGLRGLAQNNHAIFGSNNSNTIPTAKLANSGTGPALLLEDRLIVNNDNSDAITVNQNGFVGIAINATSGSIQPVIKANATGPGPGFYGFSNSSESGYFESANGRAIVGSTGNNYALSVTNNSASFSTAKITNLGGGPAMELNSDVNITVNKPIGLKIINNSNVNDGNNAAAYFIHNGSYGAGVISEVSNAGASIIGMNFGSGIGISGITNNGYAGGSFSSQSGYGASIQSQTFIAATIYNNSITHPTVFIRNATGGVALELDGNVTLNGKINQEAYQTPTFENNWNNFGGEWNTAKFYKGKDSRVYLEGVVSGGSSFVIYTLPVGYRPASRIFFMVSHNGSSRGRIDISSNGEVRFEYGSNNIQVGLDGISFRVD